MSKKSDFFIKNALGDDFHKSLENVLSKSELYKPGTRTVTDTNDMYQGLQIVPKALMGLLIRELAPMKIGETKEIPIPAIGTVILRASKHERDSISGELIQDNNKITEFLNRSIPGIGLVLMSALELYDADSLDNKPPMEPGKTLEIDKMIDERLNLHSLINKVVDGKLMERDAIRQLSMVRLHEMMAAPKPEPIVEKAEEKKEPIPVELKPAKKKLALQEFVENRNKKLSKKEFSIEMIKSESIDCSDCGQTIFGDSGISACICYGSDMGRKVFLKKTEDGIKISFPKAWSTENIEMLLEVLRGKNG